MYSPFQKFISSKAYTPLSQNAIDIKNGGWFTQSNWYFPLNFKRFETFFSFFFLRDWNTNAMLGIKYQWINEIVANRKMLKWWYYNHIKCCENFFTGFVSYQNTECINLFNVKDYVENAACGDADDDDGKAMVPPTEISFNITFITYIRNSYEIAETFSIYTTNTNHIMPCNKFQQSYWIWFLSSFSFFLSLVFFSATQCFFLFSPFFRSRVKSFRIIIILLEPNKRQT